MSARIIHYLSSALTSQPTFRIILTLTWSRARVVTTARKVTVKVDPSMVGPWFSKGRIAASAP